MNLLFGHYLEELGLLPSIVEAMGDEQLREVVKAASRALQQIHHPDKGGDAEKSSRLNHIVEVLSSEAALGLARKEYTRLDFRSRGELSEAGRELSMMETRERALQDKIRTIRGNASNIRGYFKPENMSARNWALELLSNSPGRWVEAIGLRDCLGMDFRYSPPQDITRSISLNRQLKNLSQEGSELDNEVARLAGMEERFRKLQENFDYLQSEYEKVVPSQATQEERLLRIPMKGEFKERKMKADSIMDEINILRVRRKEEEKDIERLKKRIKNLKERIARRPKKMERLRKAISEVKEPREGRIDGNGYLWLEGTRTALRIAGTCADKCTYGSRPRNGMLSVIPHLKTEKALIAVDPEGTLVNLGLLKWTAREPAEIPKTAPVEKTESEENSKPVETGMVVGKAADEPALTNPLETLGITPNMVKNLDGKALRLYVNSVSKALIKVFHPDHTGLKKAGMMQRLNEACTMVSSVEGLAKAVSEYADTDPESGRVRELRRKVAQKKNEICDLAEALACAMAEKSSGKEISKHNSPRVSAFLDSVYNGLYRMPATEIESGAHLNWSDGSVMTLASGGVRKPFTVQVRGFEAYAMSGSESLRLAGSTYPNDFKDEQQAQEALGSAEASSLPSMVQMRISRGCFLIAVADSGFRVLGKVEQVAHRSQRQEFTADDLARTMELTETLKMKRRNRDEQPSKFNTEMKIRR